MVALTKRKKAASEKTVTTSTDTVWISDKEAAQRMGIAAKTLMNWRSKQKPGQPSYYKPDGSTVRYKLHEVDAWIEAGRRDF